MHSPQITLHKTAFDHRSHTSGEPFSDNRVSYSPYLSLESNNSDLLFPKQTCRILSEDDIRHRIDDQIAQISALLCLPNPQASLLLCFFNFSVAKTLDSWFSDEPQLRRKLGVLENPLSISATEFSCGICYELFTRDMISYANCGHIFCNDCWNNYISTSINNDGFRCLVLRCPEPTCPVSIGPEMVGKLVYRNDWVKYSKCLVKSYVESHKNIKWCPSPDCVYAIEIEDYIGFSVACRCFTSICWNCELENHRPVDCETVKKWMEKNRMESENVNYIFSYCKPCPKCRRPIEKNEGCMHMVCKICLHSFCWLCLSPYGKHPKCNGYVFNNEAEKKEMAKNSLEKYTFYFERWDANRKSKLEALGDFRRAKGATFKRLSKAQGVPERDLDFISKAWLQVVECRRVLEWSYAYGYFMAENEDAKRRFFEYLQGEAESCLEKLHKCVESSDQMAQDFLGFRTMLVGLTAVTGDYFEKLVGALENGLADVVSGGNRASTSREWALENGLVDVVSIGNGASSSRERALENGLMDVVSGGDGVSSGEQALENGLMDVVSDCDGPSSSRERALENGLVEVVSGGNGVSRSREQEFEDFWLCDRCSFANPGFLAECEMCSLEDGGD